AASAGVQALYETNNVDKIGSAPEDRLRSLSGYVSWSFDRMEDARAWMGAPYLGVSGFIAGLDRLHTPGGYAGPDTDNVSRSVTLSGGSNYNNGFLSVSHTVSGYADHANNASDTV